MLVMIATLAELTMHVGSVESQRVEPRGRLPVTESVVRLDDGGSTTVWHLGGTLDGIGVRVADRPTLRLGERAVMWREGPWLRSAASLGAVRRRYVRATTHEAGVPLYWEGTNCIEVVPNAAGSADLTPEEAFGALERAVESWNGATAECSYMNLSVGEPRDDALPGYSASGTNRNVVFWQEDEWPYDQFPLAAAITTLSFIDDPGRPDDGRVFDVDIELNGEAWGFAVDCVDGRGDVDLENTLTHELGHLLGLDHTCADPAPGEERPVNHLGEPVPSCFGDLPDEVRLATMFTTARGCEDFMRTPEADDIAGICALYPLDLDPLVCEEPALPNGNGGGCAMAPGGRTGAWTTGILLVLLALLRAPACSRCRRRSGCAAASADRPRSSASA